MALSVKTKALIMRFVKGISSGIVASMSIMTVSQPEMWADFPTLFNKILLAIVYGAVTGLVLTIQKFLTWDETLPDTASQK